MARGQTVAFDNTQCIKETDAAMLVRFEDQEEPIWIPKSQVDDASEVFDDEENAQGKLVVTEWIAKEKGLI